jgi:hypothetical protein
MRAAIDIGKLKRQIGMGWRGYHKRGKGNNHGAHRHSFREHTNRAIAPPRNVKPIVIRREILMYYLTINTWDHDDPVCTEMQSGPQL